MEARSAPSPPPPPSTLSHSSSITLTHDQMKKLCDSYDLMHKTVLKSMNAYAIVLSILLAASYTGFSQPPKPIFYSNANNSSNWQKAFNYFNGFSFYSSVTGLLFYASSSFSPLLALDTSGLLTLEQEMNKKLQLLANILPKFLYVIGFFGVSLTSCVLAYAFAGLSAFPHGIFEQLPVILTASIGGLIYIQALCIFCSDTYYLISVFMRQNQNLWTVMTKGGLFGMLLGHYVEFLCRHLKVSGDGDTNPSANDDTSHHHDAPQQAGAASVATA